VSAASFVASDEGEQAGGGEEYEAGEIGGDVTFDVEVEHLDAAEVWSVCEVADQLAGEAEEDESSDDEGQEAADTGR